MKTQLSLLLVLLSFLTYAQKPIIGVDIGYQVGKKQYFETGLNLSMKINKGMFGELSFGIEDDVNANIIGYKVGLMAYDGIGKSAKRPDSNPVPILAGISIISYQISNQTVNAFRPEIGIRGIGRLGSGSTIAKLTYGYNFVDSEHEDQINKHLIRISFNTNLQSILELFSSIFH